MIDCNVFFCSRGMASGISESSMRSKIEFLLHECCEIAGVVEFAGGLIRVSIVAKVTFAKRLRRDSGSDSGNEGWGGETSFRGDPDPLKGSRTISCRSERSKIGFSKCLIRGSLEGASRMMPGVRNCEGQVSNRSKNSWASLGMLRNSRAKTLARNL